MLSEIVPQETKPEEEVIDTVEFRIAGRVKITRQYPLNDVFVDLKNIRESLFHMTSGKLGVKVQSENLGDVTVHTELEMKG